MDMLQETSLPCIWYPVAGACVLDSPSTDPSFLDITSQPDSKDSEHQQQRNTFLGHLLMSMERIEVRKRWFEPQSTVDGQLRNLLPTEREMTSDEMPLRPSRELEPW